MPWIFNPFTGNFDYSGSGGGGGSPASPSGSIQYNNGGVFGASNFNQLSNGNAEFYVPGSSTTFQALINTTFFGSRAYWFKGAGWGVFSGVFAQKNANGVGTFYQPYNYFFFSAGSLQIGQVIKVTYTISSMTVQDDLTISVGGITWTHAPSTNGTWTLYGVVSTSTGDFVVTPTVSTSRFNFSAPSVTDIGGDFSVGGQVTARAISVDYSSANMLKVDGTGAHFPQGLDVASGGITLNINGTMYSQPFSTYTSYGISNTAGTTPSNGGIQFGTDSFRIIEDGDGQGRGMAFVMGGGGATYTKFTNSGDLSLPGYILDQIDGNTPAIYPSKRWLIGADGATTVLDWSGTSVKMGDPINNVTGNYLFADPHQMYWWNNAGGHPSFTVSGDSVITRNNTLDDGAGNATFSTMNGTIGDLISTGKTVGALIQKTSNYTIAAGDSLVIMGANGATATLPTAASSTGRIITVKTASYSGGANTLASAGGNIDGAATVTLAVTKSRTVQSDGSVWHVIGGVF